MKIDNPMKSCVNYLCSMCGSHENAADYLGYSPRQYRDIRRKIEEGQAVPAWTENLIQAKARELQFAGAEHALR